MKTLSGQRNQCRGCGEFFNSNLAFDKHRTGQHGKDRRCRTPEEMLAKGMALNVNGFWVSEPYSKYRSEEHDTSAETQERNGGEEG